MVYRHTPHRTFRHPITVADAHTVATRQFGSPLPTLCGYTPQHRLPHTVTYGLPVIHWLPLPTVTVPFPDYYIPTRFLPTFLPFTPTTVTFTHAAVTVRLRGCAHRTLPVTLRLRYTAPAFAVGLGVCYALRLVTCLWLYCTHTHALLPLRFALSSFTFFTHGCCTYTFYGYLPAFYLVYTFYTCRWFFPVTVPIALRITTRLRCCGCRVCHFGYAQFAVLHTHTCGACHVTHAPGLPGWLRLYGSCRLPRWLPARFLPAVCSYTVLRFRFYALHTRTTLRLPVVPTPPLFCVTVTFATTRVPRFTCPVRLVHTFTLHTRTRYGLVVLRSYCSSTHRTGLHRLLVLRLRFTLYTAGWFTYTHGSAYSSVLTFTRTGYCLLLHVTGCYYLRLHTFPALHVTRLRTFAIPPAARLLRPYGSLLPHTFAVFVYATLVTRTLPLPPRITRLQFTRFYRVHQRCYRTLLDYRCCVLVRPLRTRPYRPVLLPLVTYGCYAAFCGYTAFTSPLHVTFCRLVLPLVTFAVHTGLLRLRCRTPPHLVALRTRLHTPPRTRCTPHTFHLRFAYAGYARYLPAVYLAAVGLHRAYLCQFTTAVYLCSCVGLLPFGCHVCCTHVTRLWLHAHCRTHIYYAGYTTCRSSTACHLVTCGLRGWFTYVTATPTFYPFPQFFVMQLRCLVTRTPVWLHGYGCAHGCARTRLVACRLFWLLVYRCLPAVTVRRWLDYVTFCATVTTRTVLILIHLTCVPLFPFRHVAVVQLPHIAVRLRFTVAGYACLV